MNVTRPSVLWLATLAVVVAVVVLLRDILLPFVAGIALAYLLNPVVERMARLGVNRTVAALGIFGLNVGFDFSLLGGRQFFDSGIQVAEA